MSAYTLPGQINISPCPFCCGPPVPICHRQEPPHGKVYKNRPFPENGTYCEAYVFCHECGAQGPRADGRGPASSIVFDADELTRLELEAVTLWNERNARHLDLFEYGVRDGHNRYPRDHAAEDASRALRKAVPGMLAMLEKIAGECSNCSGIGLANRWSADKKTVMVCDCRDCADVRAIIAQAK
jgi:hypothetical protein